ncbi:MAG: DedA family protein [bacterium]|nr:DedA family protein [bacterium]
MTDISTIISTYGYIAIVLGVAIEGKVVVFIAGIIAHHGELSIPTVIIASFVGTFLANQLFFYIGITFFKGHIKIFNKSGKETKVAKIGKMFSKHPFMVILLFRFFPGCRIMAPVIIGILRYDKIKFLIYDAVSVAITTVFLAVLGYSLGNFIEHNITGNKKADLWVVLAILILVLITALIRKYKAIKNKINKK